VAEGGGLLNRYTLIRRIEGSNPSVSAKRLKIKDFLDIEGAFVKLASWRNAERAKGVIETRRRGNLKPAQSRSQSGTLRSQNTNASRE
jgi:hypothetical protein